MFYKSEISKAKFDFYISRIHNLTLNVRPSFTLARNLLSPPIPINIANIGILNIVYLIQIPKIANN